MRDYWRAIKAFFNQKERLKKDNTWIFVSMLIGSILSLVASFELSINAVELAANPNASLTCSINAVLNCATINAHPSASFLGFPNSFIGLMAEPVVMTVAIAGLAGVKFPRLFMFAAQIGYSLGFVFALVLLYISYNIIGALCPWCLLVTLTTTLVWFAITRYNIRENNLYLPKNIQSKLKSFINKDYDKLVMWTLIVIIILAILLKYGEGIFG